MRQDNNKDAQSGQQAAEYIAEMLLQMHRIAKGAQLDTLSGLIEISFYEASSRAVSQGGRAEL